MRKRRLSAYKQSRLIEHFVAGTTARTAASLVGVNVKTATYYYQRLRVLIAQKLAAETDELLKGEIEVDESYFGGVRKGKRGRGAAGKVPVFGLLKRHGKVFTVVIDNAKSETLLPIIRDKVKPDSIVYSDSFKAYDALDISEFKHYRINHSKQFANDRNHINGIENFWSQAKCHMRRFNGVPRTQFPVYLKACEWRFNNSDPKMRLKQLIQWVRV